MRPAPAAAIDTAAIVVFVVLGRRSHHEAESVKGLVGVALPFLVALAAGWVAAQAWKAPLARRTALIVWPVTAFGGLLLRRLAWQRSTAFAFCVVATLFLALFLLGWRALAGLSKRVPANA